MKTLRGFGKLGVKLEKNALVFLCLAGVLFFICIYANGVHALPKDYEVVAGSAEFKTQDNTLTINASDKAIINYRSFDIAQNEKVLVNLPGATSQILNRVNSPDPTMIYGAVMCNGMFILVNESGIYVAPTARITAASMILSTRDITNSDFLAGEYAFRKVTQDQLDMLLLNEGKLEVAHGGFGMLIAGAIENKGVITAKAGTIVLAGANAVKLELAGNNLVSIIISEAAARQVLDYQGKPVADQIKSTGILDAEGGRVILAARSINDLFTKAVNLEGVVKGETAVSTGGGIVHIAAHGEEARLAQEPVPGAPTVLPPQDMRSVVQGGPVVDAFLGRIERNNAQGMEMPKIDLEPPASVTIEIEYKADMTADAPVTIAADEAIDAGATIEAPAVVQIRGGSTDARDSAVLQAGGSTNMTHRSGKIQTPARAEASHRMSYSTGNDEGMRVSIGIGTSIWTRGPPQQEAMYITSLEQFRSLPTSGERGSSAMSFVNQNTYDIGQRIAKLSGFVYPVTQPGYHPIP